jgi:hypothetical protein
MATITFDDESVYDNNTTAYTTTRPGGARKVTFWGGKTGRAVKLVSGTFSFDASYPAGGEDISEIAAQFAGNTYYRVIWEQPCLAGAQTGKFVRTDPVRANKKVQLFATSNNPYAEVGAASDQSLITNLGFIAIGPA